MSKIFCLAETWQKWEKEKAITGIECETYKGVGSISGYNPFQMKWKLELFWRLTLTLSLKHGQRKNGVEDKNIHFSIIKNGLGTHHLISDCLESF